MQPLCGTGRVTEGHGAPGLGAVSKPHPVALVRVPSVTPISAVTRERERAAFPRTLWSPLPPPPQRQDTALHEAGTAGFGKAGVWLRGKPLSNRCEALDPLWHHRKNQKVQLVEMEIMQVTHSTSMMSQPDVAVQACHPSTQKVEAPGG